MGKITKTMQSRHRETMSPWVRDYVLAASSTPLPLIPQKLDEFPTRWPFPRGDLYHWIPLLNRFDSILEAFCATYKLNEGFQMRDFACDLLLNQGAPVEYADEEPWSRERLLQLGYKADGDCQLIVSVLNFTRVLLQHCGNRSIYASSHHLNDLLASTSLKVVYAALEVGLELAQRYQASIKRVGTANRQVSSALLANHYNIDLDRVNFLAQPFVKTPVTPGPRFSDLPSATPVSASKVKEKPATAGHRNAASVYANDLTSLVSPGPADDGRWDGWGDVRVVYYPKVEVAGSSTAEQSPAGDRGLSSAPTTPTPLRRSSTGVINTPRPNRPPGSEDSPANRGHGVGSDDHAHSGPKSVEVRQATVQSTSVYELLKLCPADMPKSSRYEFLNRLRISKALLGSPEDRQLALAVRLLAITNLAYIHPEATFVEKVLKQDNDEPRRYQLVYQLAELIHPSADGAPETPLRLQAIALAALEAITVMQSKYAEVIAALNANVNHGILLYVVRKAVASMREDPIEEDEGKVTDLDQWRTALFALTLQMAMSTRIGQEMSSAGLLEILVQILNIRSKTATRNYGVILAFLDTIVYSFQGAFTVLSNAGGLDAISNLIIDTVARSKELALAGKGTKPEFRAQLVDYEIPFYEQQTLKWLLKFIHHIMTNAFSFGANTDRLLRNLVDNSSLLASLRVITEDMRVFGTVVWTNAATLLSDFMNNDPTSFAAISESGMIQSFLETLTGNPVTLPKPPGTPKEEAEGDEEPGSPAYSDDSVSFERDERPHPPTQEMLESPREHVARGILASYEAINVIPSILNSISLNNLGMKMIVSSHAIDSYMEIFESPEHVQLLSDSELAVQVGGSFDELARHHPALRPAISNAVIDMVSRVLHLAKTKSANAGWGAKLLVTDPSGKAVTADDSLLVGAGTAAVTAKGKGKETAEDADVEMVDASAVSSERLDANSDMHLFFPPCYFQQLQSQVPFIREGGIEMLLQLSEASSLPEDFDTTNASHTLSKLLAQLIDASPILGFPSLLNRIHATLDELEPLVGGEGAQPFFAPFVVPNLSLLNDKGEWDQSLIRKVAGGTRVVRALVRLQSLIRTLHHSFPYASRQQTVTMPAVHVFDYFVTLVKRLGPLLRGVSTEDMAIAALVPQHWTGSKSVLQDGAEAPSPPALPSGPDDAGEGAAGHSREDGTESSAQPKKPTEEERSTTQFRNYLVIHRLLHSLSPSTLPFFQTIAKTLLPRRGVDSYVRSRHLDIAEALAETVLAQLQMSQETLAVRDLHYWIVMFHTLHEMLVDSSRPNERSYLQLSLPVLVAFKEHGGIELLNTMLLKFADEVCKGAHEGEDAHKARLATAGMKNILEIYHLIVNGKNVCDSLGQTNLVPRTVDRSRDFGHQLVVELRLAVLPTIRKLWESEFVEKAPVTALSRVIDIIKTIAAADQESNAWRKSDKTSPPPIFKQREHVRFNWIAHADQVKNLTRLDYDEELAREAVYRANGRHDDSAEYCRAHSKGLAGNRNPIPEEDAYRPPPSPKSQEAGEPNAAGSSADSLAAGPMSLDPVPEINNFIQEAIDEAVLGALGDHSSDESNDTSHDGSSQHSANQEPSAEPSLPAHAETASSSAATESPAFPRITKEDLDKERAELQTDLIDRCLDVIRAHPDLVFDISDLIHATILKSDNEEKRVEVGDILANALMSFAMDDDDEKRSNSRGIAAYAHLLSLLLQNRQFFKSTLPSLKENISDYLSFLKVSPASSNEELPSWIPYILLIFEILLSDDEQPVEAVWKAPANDDDPVEQPVWVAKELNLSAEDRSSLLTAILEILPRIGKEESLAVSVLRLLVILTRDHSMAKVVGEKRNLQRLFVMAKQSCGGGSSRLNQSHIADNIMIVLRHIVEDEEIIRQMMQTEIRQYLASSRNPRSYEIQSYLRQLSHVALRAPKLFVDVTTELVKLSRWSSAIDPAVRSHSLSLKDVPAEQSSPSNEGADGSAVQGAEDAPAEDVKPSTESADKEKDKEMADAPKTPFELKRPVLENPDGVVHFLLCELLNYKEVDDKEPPSHALKEAKAEGGPSASGEEGPSSAAGQQPADQKDKEKKPSKPIFKAEDHPIFVYRCFLLNCLAELLQNFNRAKVEFINFKRSAPMQTSTPIKPRSSVLNYLINDLLCLGPAGAPMDSTIIKKKAATSTHAQAVLVALVARTPEKPIDRNRNQFEYDDDPDLLFVRRFVLDTLLRAYKEAATPGEPVEVRYGKMMCAAELMSLMIGEKERDAQQKDTRVVDPAVVRSQMQLKRLMYEKGYIAALTASIADIDLTFPNVKRTIKYILRVLRALTKTAFLLSQSDVIPVTSTDQPEDDFASTSSLSDMDDREETPDLYRNSTLGILEPGREEDFSDESEDDEDAMYDDEPYDDELDYEDEMSQDEEENPSDEDEEELDEMGEIEGLPGDQGVVEVIMGENDDDDDEDEEDEEMDEDDDDEPSDSEDDEEDEDEDEMGSEDMEEVEDRIEIVNEEGNPMDDDGASGWESETDEENEEAGGEVDFEGEAQDIHEALMHGHNADQLGPIPDILRNVVDGDDLDGEDIHDLDDHHYIDDGADDEDEDEDDEGDEDEAYYDQDHLRDDHLPHNMPSGLGWDVTVEPQPRFRHGGARSPFPSAPFIIGGHRDLRDPLGNDFRNFIRHGHPRPPPNPTDDGVNPLLLSNRRPGQEHSSRETSQPMIRLGLPGGLMGPGMDGPLAFINELMQNMPFNARGSPGVPAFSFQLRAPSGEVRHLNLPLDMSPPARDVRWDTRWEPRREVYQEPQQAVNFSPESTAERWQQEAKMIFGFNHNEKSRLLSTAILGMLTPAAIQREKEAKAREEAEKRKREEERKKREEEERKEREAKEAEERAAREKKEAEERERQERERVEAEAEAARAAEEATPAAEATAAEPQAMEGVESHAEAPAEEQQPAARERVVTTIRGETVDITELGIDPEYLAALPEEFREEVIAQTVSARRSQAREQAANEGENTEVFQEFLEALPAELRMEIVQQERQERRRREREEQRRQAAASGQALGPAEMDPASILLTFPPALREQVLLEQGEDIMDQLPPDLAAEARALAQRHNLQHHRATPAAARSRDAVAHRPEPAADSKPQRRTIVQMLDKAGVATLLRLMFITQQSSIRNYLFDVFAHVCENRHNRLDVISTLLQILQDGSTDMDAVERSFSQLSLKAKQPKDNKEPKTPQSLKRSLTNISAGSQMTGVSEVSPLLVVQQCLDLLQELATKNPHIPSLFLTEHETVASSLKRSSSRKGKGKDVNAKAQRFAINSLLALLDRNLIMESSSVMQLLADLLNKVTYPLQAIERRRKEAEEEAKRKAEEKAKEAEKAGEAEKETENAGAGPAETSESQPSVPQPTGPTAGTSTEGAQAATQEGEKPEAEAESSTAKESQSEEKKTRQLTPPTIPEHNLKLVINIFVARECSSKTFQNTISTIKNLSNIPGAKKVFGEELVAQARALSENIVSDLEDLLPHILRAESGTEIQGIALAKFSPGASEQNKLLRVLTALDHLFDSKAKKSNAGDESSKEDLLGSLYWNPTFGTMWEKLGACLSAIRQRENMLNVATILLPLIESLMVVCKNTALDEAPLSQSKEMLLTSPPPDNRIASLFFRFTEEHRRILNELVRQNPKLMSGTFSLLVKNPKVLEFDNKRNYFNRSVHAKTGQQRQQYPSLQLSVRREHVFHDSFKSLYFKSGPEMKFGKLNIRFHGEEGVDAGGVTREWFQVLARQMFDPNYALFIPVSSDRTTFHPNKLSGINDEHLMFFKFIGRIIGKALYEGRLLDCYFSRAVYKRILGKPVSVKDMESFDPDYYKSLVWMLENDITDIITETFSVEDDEFGVTKVVDLIENGRNIPVTEENKHEYVRLIVEHKLLTSVKDQMEHFLKGFHDIIPEDLIAIFTEQELELLISGLPDIDVDDWKSNTEYHNYTAASQQIQWFWRAVRSFDKEERAKLLQFVTGTSKVPLNGFKELEGMNGINRFNIHRDYGNKDRLPSSHTCFNQLDLPEYESYDILRSQLLKAITAGSDYFGFA
ncbi:41446123-6e7b-48cd-a2b2-30d8e8c21136 [Thermothielavioides terrestris]|uniref:HECT-type E3 ubiquitin transferase n=1 Tax=Thermothielavioides terrestris TaxID=2587410 RepID=A0A446BYJ8_9PEZI|nr:41446123-6e7b-48cd-a2b2-30d8e8c21136 [Thermothielavioides terrestris]